MTSHTKTSMSLYVTYCDFSEACVCVSICGHVYVISSLPPFLL